MKVYVKPGPRGRWKDLRAQSVTLSTRRVRFGPREFGYSPSRWNRLSKKRRREIRAALHVSLIELVFMNIGEGNAIMKQADRDRRALQFKVDDGRERPHRLAAYVRSFPPRGDLGAPVEARANLFVFGKITAARARRASSDRRAR